MVTVEATAESRTRTVSWDDPSTGVALVRRMSGIEYLHAIKRGDAPAAPLTVLLGIEPVEVTEGRAVFTLEPAEYHYNPMGSVHGGVTAALLDSAMGCAVLSTLPAGTSFTTLDLTVQLVRALTAATGTVRCEGRALHVGGRVATAEARLIDEDGRLYANATSTCLITRPQRAEPAA